MHVLHCTEIYGICARACMFEAFDHQIPRHRVFRPLSTFQGKCHVISGEPPPDAVFEAMASALKGLGEDLHSSERASMKQL